MAFASILATLVVRVQPFHRGELIQLHMAFNVKFCF